MSSVEVRQAGPEDREAWERFRSTREDAEMGHAWSYHALLEQVFGVKAVRLVARCDGECVGILPFGLQRSIVGRFLTSVPYLSYAGVLGDDAEARRSLARQALELARELKIDRLEIRGRSGGDLPVEAWSEKSGFTSDLPATPEVLWKALGSKVRSQVKRPRKEGYSARVVGHDGRRAFYALLAGRWHELGSPVLPERFFAALGDWLGDAMEYVLVEREGRPAAAGVIVHGGRTVEIPWAASARPDNRFGVNMLLYWTAIERAIERGATRFDYGRSTPGTGNARFKLQWGAREQPLVWNVFTRSGKGRSSERGSTGRGLAAALWRKMPAVVVQHLGPRLAARIPL